MRPPEKIIASMWLRLMPASLEVPDDFQLYTWGRLNLDDIQYAIERTAERMTKNIQEGIPATSNLAVRYATPILRQRAEWRTARLREKQAGAQ